MERPNYLDNIVYEKDVTIENGPTIHCYFIDDNFTDEVLNKWALHVRRNYIDDESLNSITKDPTERYDFLCKRLPNKIGNPTETQKLSTITGEFAEILIADFRQFVLGENVFRVRWKTKSTPDSPVQGCDIVSYTLDCENHSKDTLVVTESKSCLSTSYPKVLIDAAEDSKKDSFRIAETIAFLEQQYADRKEYELSNQAKRFANKAAEPFIEIFEGSGLTTDYVLSEQPLKDLFKDYKADTKSIYFIYGNDLKDLSYDIYERALRC